MLFDLLEEIGLRKLIAVSDPPSGLRAVIAIDDTTLGPAAGGVRTLPYASARAAVTDAARLARTMTHKCALAGLPCGGGKATVMDHAGLDRAHAFEVLGAAVESLGGLFLTAGDLGTRDADLRAMERRTRYVHRDVQGLDLSGATARGVVLAAREGAAAAGLGELAGARALVQGVGAVGAAVARALADEGAAVLVSDLDPQRAHDVAREVGGEVVDPADALATPCELFAPCAASDVVDLAAVEALACRVVCGAANNPLAGDAVADALAARGVLYVPDFVANAGAVIEGIGSSLLGLDDRTALVERIAATARAVLDEAAASGKTPLEVARAMAQARIDAAMPKWRRPG